jgi:phosphoglycerate dehydrogenase-like enzyme
MSKRILITPRSVTAEGHPALARLREAGYELVFATPGQQPSEEELLRLLPGCIGYLAGVEPITAVVIESASELRVISRNGTGIDNIDLAAARRKNIRICRAEAAPVRSVAELTIGLMFALARAIPASDRALKAGQWRRQKGMEMAGKTLGLIGCGRVGRAVAGLALALGMEVLAFDILPDDAFNPAPQFRFTTLGELLRQAQFVSLHCPPLPDGKCLLDAEKLGWLRPGAFLINTARASLVDAHALRAALDAGRVAAAAIDVFEKEPPQDDPLVGHERVVVTPHIGGHTVESIDQAIAVAVENLLEALKP